MGQGVRSTNRAGRRDGMSFPLQTRLIQKAPFLALAQNPGFSPSRAQRQLPAASTGSGTAPIPPP